MINTPNQPADPTSLADGILRRPFDQRIREYKYRCAQSIVFGLPVLALQLVGDQIGGPESQRWVPLLQAVLTVWIVYVGSVGMLSEGLMLLCARRRVTADLVVALVSVGMTTLSLGSVVGVFVTGQVLFRPLLFHVTVIVLVAWNAAQWARLSRKQVSG